MNVESPFEQIGTTSAPADECWVTVEQLAARAVTSPRTVSRDIRRGLVRADRPKGVRGLRIRCDRANRYLRLKFPNVIPY